MPSPIPVVVTDCVGDCLVIAHQARDAVYAAFATGAVAAGLLVLFAAATFVVVAFRRR